MTSSSLFHWRGLRSCRDLSRFTLRCECGIWGKAPGARSDYRWLARSKGFADLSRGLERVLLLGTEDEPRSSVYWKSWEGRFYAVKLYRSRARDSAGRSGFTEKQILTWSGAALPPALAAFILLAAAAELDDSVWFDRGREARWDDPDFVLDLGDDDLPRLEVTEERLAELVGRGLEELRQHAKGPALGRLFSRILEGRPAWLQGLTEPLPAAALAALLLDLEPARAVKLSLAGWVPSARADAGITERWNVLVEPAGKTFAEYDARGTSREGEALTARLLANEPAAPAPESPAAPLSSVEAPASVPKPSRRQDVPRPAPAEKASRPEPARGRRPVPPLSSFRVALGPGSKIPLEEVSSAAPFLSELHKFAASVDRRRIQPPVSHREKIRLLRFPDEDAEGVRLWVDQLERLLPEYKAIRQMPLARADEDDWAVKVDLLRSAALVLAPRPELGAELLDTFRSGRVPPFYMGRMLADDDRDELVGRLGTDVLRRAAAESRSCPYAPWRREVETWMESWAQRCDRRETAVAIRGY